MSIETHIAELTAALKENTAVMREILASAGQPTAEKRTRKAKGEPAPEPVQTEQEAPVEPAPVQETKPEEPADEPAAPIEETVIDFDAYRQQLKEDIKSTLLADTAFNVTFQEARAKFGIALLKDLPDEKLVEFRNHLFEN